jgi:hypothetical protein
MPPIVLDRFRSGLAETLVRAGSNPERVERHAKEGTKNMESLERS